MHEITSANHPVGGHHGGGGSGNDRHHQDDVPDAPEMRFPKGSGQRSREKTTFDRIKGFLLEFLPDPDL